MQRPHAVEAGTVERQQIVEDLEPDSRVGQQVERQGRVLQDRVRVGAGDGVREVQFQGASVAGGRVEVDDRAALGRAALGRAGGGPRPERQRVADGQDAVVDDRLAAVGVAPDPVEDQLPGADLGEVVAAGEAGVGDESGYGKRGAGRRRRNWRRCPS